MKFLKCPICHREKEVPDKIIISFCPTCLCEMELFKPKTLAGEKYTANKVVKEVLDNSIKVTKVKEIKK